MPTTGSQHLFQAMNFSGLLTYYFVSLSVVDILPYMVEGDVGLNNSLDMFDPFKERLYFTDTTEDTYTSIVYSIVALCFEFCELRVGCVILNDVSCMCLDVGCKGLKVCYMGRDVGCNILDVDSVPLNTSCVFLNAVCGSVLRILYGFHRNANVSQGRINFHGIICVKSSGVTHVILFKGLYFSTHIHIPAKP